MNINVLKNVKISLCSYVFTLIHQNKFQSEIPGGATGKINGHGFDIYSNLWYFIIERRLKN